MPAMPAPEIRTLVGRIARTSRWITDRWSAYTRYDLARRSVKLYAGDDGRGAGTRHAHRDPARGVGRVRAARLPRHVVARDRRPGRHQQGGGALPLPREGRAPRRVGGPAAR